MTRRFALIVDDATREQQDSVTNWLRTTELSFWHYLSDVWLVLDSRDTETTVSLRDHLKQAVPGKTTMVLKVDGPNNWAAFGPTDKFKWLHSTWAGKPAA